ncbi:kinase-like domain-containing protein [Mycena galericulata]|nr:kinase-like domain-containing protein [Mycena galericulata]
MSPPPPNRQYTHRYQSIDQQVVHARFSAVNIAKDTLTSNLVAVKTMAAELVTITEFKREVRTLLKIRNLATHPTARFAKILDYYANTSLRCIVFEPYAATLETILASRVFAPLPAFQVQDIGLQIMQAVDFLHQNGIIHTDMNTRNVMLLSIDSHVHKCYGSDAIFHDQEILVSTEIRIIDFGSVGERANNFTKIIGTAGYRSPEILLGWEWTETVDHFAVGCILAELDTCRPLFLSPVNPSDDGDEDAYYLAMMVHILGPLTTEMRLAMLADWPDLLCNGPGSKPPPINADRTPTLKERISERELYKFPGLTEEPH